MKTERSPLDGIFFVQSIVDEFLFLLQTCAILIKLRKFEDGSAYKSFVEKNATVERYSVNKSLLFVFPALTKVNELVKFHLRTFRGKRNATMVQLSRY